MASQLPRSAKIAVIATTDAVSVSAAAFLGIALQGGSASNLEAAGVWPYVAAVASCLPAFLLLGLYRAITRFVGSRTNTVIAVGVTISTMSLALLALALQPSYAPLTTTGIYWAFALIFTTGSRAIAKSVFRRGSHRARERVAIYGAGKAGTEVAALLQTSSDYTPIAFIDDKKGLTGHRINGITVYPSPALPALIQELAIQTVLLAIPSASRRRRHEILGELERLGVRVQSIPGFSDILSGRARINDVRDVDVGDILGRETVPPDPSLFRTCIEGKSVMVTGAGGSIGSELCRQIVSLNPCRLVLFEMSELALYTIEQDIRQIIVREGLQIEVIPLLGSVHHRHRVRDAMFACGVQTVYHAAAYKHVPIVEHNIIEGLHNNVIGTWYTAEAALDAEVETFVLISTDKAVNPTNVMGATKRFAELVLQGLQNRGGKTRFCMVRFGNVLDSSGSVVPLFREQIRRGGPVTVTHPEVIRYFMTIPEAAQLVIQAGAMGTGGDVFVLDMGQPVRIADLARKMIHLMGLSVRDESNPNGEIEIQYTGLRTAEKLYEELLIGSNATGTDHPRIMRAIEHSLPWVRVQDLLNDLMIALTNFDCQRALGRLSDAVSEYSPTTDIQDHIWARRGSIRPSDDPKVAVITPKRRKTDDMSEWTQR